MSKCAGAVMDPTGVLLTEWSLSVKVGDLVRERGYPEIGLIMEKRDISGVVTYKILCSKRDHWASAMAQWFPREYIENDCELINESR